MWKEGFIPSFEALLLGFALDSSLQKNLSEAEIFGLRFIFKCKKDCHKRKCFVRIILRKQYDSCLIELIFLPR